MMTTLIENCLIGPPPGAAAEQSLPLTFSDIIWLPLPPVRRLIFYESPIFSHPYLLQTLVPKLKQSLSLTLKHFFPLAGTLIYPLNTDKKPELCYKAGDSVPVTFSESSCNFDDLVSNQARNADEFYDFLPKLSPTVEESDRKILQVFTIQVTLFPGRGVCFGFSNHHSVGDASSIFGFIKAWGLINKNGECDDQFLPVFDRGLVKYPDYLDSVYLNFMKKIPFGLHDFPVPTGRFRATYAFTRSELERLKILVQGRIPGLVHVSSFVVMAAYVWSCLAKSFVKEVELETFLFPVDFRARIDPPVPGNYFGNCLSFGLAKVAPTELVGDEGFFLAAEAIARKIESGAIDGEKILEGAERRLEELGSVVWKPFFSVSGSGRVDLYGADFGWGRARKVEALSIDGERYSMSLCKCRGVEGGFEVGLSLPKVNMDAFAAYFSQGLKAE